MKNLNEIRETLLRQKEKLKERYQVKELGIFGSFVRNEQKDDSDIDIFVEFSETPNMFKFIDLEIELEEILNHKVALSGVRRSDLN
jgi:uncharacterized protein